MRSGAPGDGDGEAGGPANAPSRAAARGNQFKARRRSAFATLKIRLARCGKPRSELGGGEFNDG